MNGAWRAAILAVALSAASASSAWADTVLHVDAVHGSDTGNCQSAPCKTLGYAVTQGRFVPDVITIQAAPGTYTEDLALNSQDSGLTISGAGSGTDPGANTIVMGISGNPTINTSLTDPLTLEHLRIVTPAGDSSAAISADITNLTLSDVAVDIQGAGAAGIACVGPLTMTGGSVTVENAGAGTAIAETGPASLSGTPVSSNGSGVAIQANGTLGLTNSPATLTNAADSAPAVEVNNARSTIAGSPIDVKGTGPGIVASGPLQLTNSSVTLENTTGSAPAIIGSGPTAPITDTGGPIDVKGTAPAVDATNAPMSLTGIKITLDNAASGAPAILTDALGSSLSHVTVSGAWQGLAIEDTGSISITDSTLSSGSSPAAPLAIFSDGTSTGLGDNVSIQRSTLDLQSTTLPEIIGGNVNMAVDSSELLGGSELDFQASLGVSRTLTIASSTVDAGTLGTRDIAPVQSVLAQATNMAGTAALVNVEGSILLEPPAATRGGTTSTASVTCSDTEVPDTTQSATSSLGTIACGAGSDGNTFTSSLSSIFASPSSGYALNPTWSGVDSVPESAISLPSPFSDSTTDLLGSPRVLNGVGTCLAGIRDKGAIELTGHGGTVPAPVIAGPASVYTGTLGAFTGSAPNIAPGVPLTYSWTSSDGGAGSGQSFSRSFAHPGTATVTLTVKGAAGCTGSASKTVTVHGIDALSRLKLSPGSFFAAPSGATVVAAAKRTYGTVVSYLGTESATTTFRLTHLIPGRRQGRGACRPLTQKNRRKGRACTIPVQAGAFTHNDLPGTVRFRFSGRLGSRKLAKGNYRLQAVSSDPAGKSVPLLAPFTVKG